MGTTWLGISEKWDNSIARRITDYPKYRNPLGMPCLLVIHPREWRGGEGFERGVSGAPGRQAPMRVMSSWRQGGSAAGFTLRPGDADGGLDVESCASRLAACEVGCKSLLESRNGRRHIPRFDDIGSLTKYMVYMVPMSWVSDPCAYTPIPRRLVIPV